MARRKSLGMLRVGTPRAMPKGVRGAKSKTRAGKPFVRTLTSGVRAGLGELKLKVRRAKNRTAGSAPGKPWPWKYP